ncbi:hypothetical protein [Edaphobacter modestus]|uniref:hypothetical protein n=1 Tax=Edaphobacter modestus TaxID=388466 RepID=UPI00102C31A4|nr:hypothetical protein [Edaphobacter modestus]
MAIPVDEIERAKLCLARALVELPWSVGRIPQIFDVEHEGARWEVAVRLKGIEDGDLPSFEEKDFTEKLPE